MSTKYINIITHISKFVTFHTCVGADVGMAASLTAWVCAVGAALLALRAMRATAPPAICRTAGVALLKPQAMRATAPPAVCCAIGAACDLQRGMRRVVGVASVFADELACWICLVHYLVQLPYAYQFFDICA